MEETDLKKISNSLDRLSNDMFEKSNHIYDPDYVIAMQARILRDSIDEMLYD